MHEQSPGRMNNGVFGPWDACPKGAFAVGFRARFSPFHGAVHTPDKRNMGVAAIHLLCEDPPGRPMRWSPVYISSNEVRRGKLSFFEGNGWGSDFIFFLNLGLLRHHRLPL